ncbi:uncharacterized protein LOC133173853 [Saccostrea echinata]|uniref:uncharacterized protein LOC133173853 n=1 Tax=Saccostrea echinata TaxID=191078 RepID=UPI002A839EB0|nr:uncharacterized protein LOC133173853 [Saccostrea echinata]
MALFVHWITIILSFQKIFGVENCLKSVTSSVCCADYYVENGNCVPCPIGLFGPNCTHTCPYPSYGHRCLEGICQCPQELCDSKTGCRNPSKDKQISSTHLTSITTRSVPLSNHRAVLGNLSTSTSPKEINVKKSEDNKIGSDDNKAGSAAVMTVISVIGVLIVCLLIVVIVFQIKGKIKMRIKKPTNRGPHVTSQRHVDTYCEIDEGEVTEDKSKTLNEFEIYELIDQSKKDGTKYTPLPPRPGLSKEERAVMSTVSMQKILEDDDNNDDDDTKVQMRKEKINIQNPPKRMGKTSAQVSGYIDMNKEREEEDYVPMAAEKSENNTTSTKDIV